MGFKWYKSTLFTILMLVFIAPVGIFLTWKYATWSKTWKIIASVISGFFFFWVITLIINAPPVLTIDNARNGRIETENAKYTISGTVTTLKGSLTLTVNNKPEQINNSKYSATVEVKEGENTITVTAKRDDKTSQESVIVYRLSASEIQARKDAEAARKMAEAEAESKKKADAKVTDANKKSEQASTAESKKVVETKQVPKSNTPTSSTKSPWETAKQKADTVTVNNTIVKQAGGLAGYVYWFSLGHSIGSPNGSVGVHLLFADGKTVTTNGDITELAKLNEINSGQHIARAVSSIFKPNSGEVTKYNYWVYVDGFVFEYPAQPITSNYSN